MDREVVHKMFGEKKQNLPGPKGTAFLLLCALKKHIFSATKGPPHEWCSTRCKILPLQLASFSFTKMQASERGRIPSYLELQIFGPCNFFDFCHQTSYEQLPYPFPELGSFLIPQSCLPEYKLRGGPPFPLMKRFIMAIVYVSPRAMVWRNPSSFWCLHLCKGKWGWGQLQRQDLAAGRTPFVGGDPLWQKNVLF